MGALLARELRLWAWLIAVTSTMAAACSNTAPNGQGLLTFFSNNSAIVVRLQLDL